MGFAMTFLPQVGFGYALAQVVALAQGANVAVNVSLSCVFGCPMEGDVAQAVVFGWVQRFVDLGVRGITLCDTTGMAYPTQVHQLTAAARARWQGVEFTLHFHNTRGMGLANVLAAIDAGADRFDTSLGGLGGCPFAGQPKAAGNICTEELVLLCEEMGIETGVDLPALAAALFRPDLPQTIIAVATGGNTDAEMFRRALATLDA